MYLWYSTWKNFWTIVKEPTDRSGEWVSDFIWLTKYRIDWFIDWLGKWTGRCEWIILFRYWVVPLGDSPRDRKQQLKVASKNSLLFAIKLKKFHPVSTGDLEVMNISLCSRACQWQIEICLLWLVNPPATVKRSDVRVFVGDSWQPESCRPRPLPRSVVYDWPRPASWR